ncbi:MAG: S49 family peptidase [Alphaproteobacteria bacterium]
MAESAKSVWPWERERPPLVPVVRLMGTIGPDGNFDHNLNIASVGGLLEAAFSVRRAAAVALVINSPGGTAAQSALLYRRIVALKKEKQLPVLAFVEDVAASGGYMIACAADEIFADPLSIVGSIGVRTGGFGFHEAMQRLGVERRIYTAGGNKARLDPFMPQDPADVDWVNDHLREAHRLFIDLVKDSRGETLKKAGDTDLFTGEVWHGEPAMALGLIDGIGDVRSILKDRFGEAVRMRMLSRRRPWWENMLPFSGRRNGPSVDLPVGSAQSAAITLLDADAVARTLEKRALWARYGL